MGITISGSGIDMGGNPVSNASQIEVQENQVSPYNGFKNYIINGNFDIWQRGNSQTISDYGSDDRWSNNNNGSTKTHSRVNCTDTERVLFNATYYSRTVATSVAGVGNVTNKTQAIENVTKLAGKTVTISFWARASSTMNIQLDIAQSYGTGGSPSLKTHNPQTPLQITPTWQKKTITVTIPSIVGKTLGTDGAHTSFTQLYFIFEAGASWLSGITIGQQSGTFDIAQVQLEEGSVATPFEQRPYGLELSLYQRYYWKSLVTGIVVYNSLGAGYNEGFIKNPVQMRVVPTVTSHSAVFENHHGSNFDYISPRNTTSEIAVSWATASLVRPNSGRFDAVVSASAEL